ncbi:hypothetical protein SLS58_008225 [Diplodia intermedia]|uniref:Uncharacterized protein n=1 Tax=Diplodia intermedia TaxID=856260 RepID=A0ABR3TI16_9PEZI
MIGSTITSLALGLLAFLPTTHAADSSSSLHYRLRARVTGPKNASTPPVDGWALEVQRLGVPTRLPADYMWGVLINATFAPSRGGDIFYHQQSSTTTANTTTNGTAAAHIRTDAPNNAGEVTPFGITALAGSRGYPMDGVEMAAVRYIGVPKEEVLDVADGAGGDGVPHLHKPAANGTFAACSGLYQEWATLYWIDVAAYGADPIYTTGADYQECTPIELVPECADGGPSHDGLEERPCVKDVAAVL